MQAPPPILPPPEPRLAASVVVPALDEAERIEACVEALARQTAGEPFELILVDDRSRDGTAGRARRAASVAGLTLHVVRGPGAGPGIARGLGAEIAARRLVGAGSPAGLVASTDADTRVAPDWLACQLALIRAGADAVGGWVELDGHEAARLDPAVLDLRVRRAAERLATVRRLEPHAEHHHFAGASFGVRADRYLELGIALPAVLEDEAIAASLNRRGMVIARSHSVRVTTSARTDGRAALGLAADLRAASAVAAGRAAA